MKKMTAVGKYLIKQVEKYQDLWYDTSRKTYEAGEHI